MSLADAKGMLSDAIYALKLARIGLGPRPGAREIEQAVINAEQAEMWLNAAEQAKSNDTGTNDDPVSGD